MREMTAKTVKKTLQQAINAVKKLETSSFKEEVDKYRLIGYLSSVSSQVIDKHDTEKRLDEIEKILSEEEEKKIA